MITQRMQHLAHNISLGICIALEVGSPLAAQQREKAPLTATGEKLQAQYAATLKALQAEIAKSLPNVPDKKNADLVKAREALKTAETAANTAQGSQAKINTAKALVAHAKNKWIGGAEKGIATAQAALKKATTEAVRESAKKDLDGRFASR